MCVFHAGMLVFADVVVAQLAATVKCTGLSSCTVPEARSLVPELKLVLQSCMCVFDLCVFVCV